jgi:Ni,Fe-hydrogenase I small subunit
MLATGWQELVGVSHAAALALQAGSTPAKSRQWRFSSGWLHRAQCGTGSSSLLRGAAAVYN